MSSSKGRVVRERTVFTDRSRNAPYADITSQLEYERRWLKEGEGFLERRLVLGAAVALSTVLSILIAVLGLMASLGGVSQVSVDSTSTILVVALGAATAAALSGSFGVWIMRRRAVESRAELETRLRRVSNALLAIEIDLHRREREVEQLKILLDRYRKLSESKSNESAASAGGSASVLRSGH